MNGVELREIVLGPDIAAGQRPQGIVRRTAGRAPKAWAAGPWSLHRSPAFDFAGFELAPPVGAPGRAS